MKIQAEFIRRKLEEIKFQRRSKYSEVNAHRVLYIRILCDILKEATLEVERAEDTKKIEEIVSLLRDLEGEYPEAQKAILGAVELIEDKMEQKIK